MRRMNMFMNSKGDLESGQLWQHEQDILGIKLKYQGRGGGVLSFIVMEIL